jgi:hypothetical protein
MSLHAQLSQEAQSRLDSMKRNSTISSIIIAFLAVILVGLLLTFILIDPIFKDTEAIMAYKKPEQPVEKITAQKVNTSTTQKPSAPSMASARVLVSLSASNLSIPVPEADVPLPSNDYGNGDDFGQGGLGDGTDGNGSPGSFVGITTSVSKRCSKEDRIQRLAETGGNEQCEEAVLKSLRWMKSTQAADGSWGGANKTAMTGLGLLAYLGHCETPISEEFGESCLKAITFLINHGMKNNGMLADNPAAHSGCYEHAIAAYALAESTTFCKQLKLKIPNLEEVTQKAGQIIIDRQHKNGGWAYEYSEADNAHTDVSIVGWQLQALKAMKLTGLDFKNLPRCASKGLEFFDDKQAEDGGYGYTNANPVGAAGFHTLTGVGVLCLQIWGKESTAGVRNGAKCIGKTFKLDWNTKDSDLYAHYYAAQAMMNRGGNEWKKYNDLMRDEVLKNQNADGTWKDIGNGAGVGGALRGNGQAQFYRNCLATLMLEVYYRFLPSSGGR